VGMVQTFNSNGIESDFIDQFTFQGLQEHQSELEWK
jgi:hypothetical protein